MRNTRAAAIALLSLGLLSSSASAEWVTFIDATASRLAVSAADGASDPSDKAFAWGDLDQDGDVDLVVARMLPNLGKQSGLLLLNDGGVLTDHTAALATASDLPGDQGFATPTSSRDVVVVDFDQDGWLDVVTAATLSDGDPKHIGHPRAYRNLGCEAPCASGWQGLRYEHARIPALLSYTGQSGHNPRFNSVSAGDVTGDGYPDLWFSDFDRTQDINKPAGADFNDRLLVNDGAANPGYFADGTSALVGNLQVPGHGGVFFEVSSFSAASAIGDFNGDGSPDILKVTAGQAPNYVGLAMNNPVPGTFEQYRTVPSVSAYAVSARDLDRDGKLDIIETDNGQDRYLLNQGNDGGGGPFFTSYPFTYAHSGTGLPSGDAGVGGESFAADLDHDGWTDVLIPDIDADNPGCNRRMNIYRNLGSSGPGMLQEQTSGTNCAHFLGHPPSCIVAGIPASELKGMYDVAVFDLDGDGWLDMVLGRCAGTRVFTNVPPAAAGSVPDGSGSDEMLRLGQGAGDIELDWGASCLTADTDYAIYAGSLGAGFEDHVPLTCTTAGATAYSVELPQGSTYYLIVAHNTKAEGSYGTSSQGERRPSNEACLPQHIAACE